MSGPVNVSSEVLRDPSAWIIALGVAVRIAALTQFSAENGYDAPLHFAYVDALRDGTIPRVGSGPWTAHHPPLYYVMALLTQLAGLGRTGGQLVALLSGVARLVLVDRLYRKLGLSTGERATVNAIHTFLPFTIRSDVFFTNESMATTLALAAVFLAFERRTVWTGLALGAALLTKASAVAAVLAVSFLLVLPRDRAAAKRLFAVGMISLAVFLPWAWPNVARYHTPYPNAYTTQSDPEWSLPVWKRHAARYYLPELTAHALEWPYFDPPESMVNALVFDSFGDYYNFLGKGPHHVAPPNAANGRALTAGTYATHRILTGVGLVLTALLLVGAGRFLVRVVRRQAQPLEVSLALLGVGQLAIVVIYSAAVIHELDGAPKATYALGLAPIGAAWVGRELRAGSDAMARRGRLAGRAAQALTVCLTLSLVLGAIAQRIAW
ncbi:MAG: glycosyltransferase family 39 protein [Deltaproteobacteria bacterium]|nr:glycosyltransferase family 39 protein [Deltaproteobacteria bacterium]